MLSPPAASSPTPRPPTPLLSQTILEEPPERWPQCDCLLSWHSDGFPLKKAQA